MTLPDVSIPLSLPFEVLALYHPLVVHFAVVLPIIVLFLELFNLFFKRRALSVASLIILLAAVLAFAAAYFTGKADGREAWDLLSAEAREELRMHRILGTYLVYALLVPLLFKLLAMLLAQKWARGVLILSLVLIISFVFKQGHDGGELVYHYGVNVAPVSSANESVQMLNENIADLNESTAQQAEEIETLRAQLKSCQQEANETISQDIKSAVSEAVSKVKKMFDETNGTTPSHPENDKVPATGLNDANTTI